MNAYSKDLRLRVLEAVDRGLPRKGISDLFVDECSTNVRLVPLRARTPKGRRAFGKTPRNWHNNVTLISSISLEGMGASMSIEGSADGEAFSLYVERFLCPTLKPGQIVVTTSRCTRCEGCGSSSKGVAARLCSCLLTPLPQPRRGGLLEGQDAAQEGQGQKNIE